jgi:hypothetical protein
MATLLEIAGVGCAAAAAVCALLIWRVKMPSITIAHRDELPTALRRQSRFAGYSAVLAAAAALFQILQLYWGSSP